MKSNPYATLPRAVYSTTHAGLWIACIVVGLVGAGCGKSEDADAAVARTPREAAGQLESAFSQAPEVSRTAAISAAQAMRDKEYEKAVVSLQTVKATEGITLEQGMAVHGSIVNLEAELISAANSGDPKAKQAYELLKALKRK